MDDPSTEEVHWSVLRERAGVSFRQIDYWVRTGVIRPSLRDAVGSGSRRVWASIDADVVVVVARFARLGARHDVLKWAAATAFELLEAGLTDAWLLVDGRTGEATVTLSSMLSERVGQFADGCWAVPICPPDETE